VRVTDVASDEDLQPIWGDAQAETATHYQRAAALRQLAALARAGLTSDPGERRGGAERGGAERVGVVSVQGMRRGWVVGARQGAR
jgi:hypothetical protein